MHARCSVGDAEVGPPGPCALRWTETFREKVYMRGETEKERVARERERERDDTTCIAAGCAVSCRQIYRVARADSEQCRFILSCFLPVLKQTTNL